MEPTFDDDGYPSEDTLKVIEDWDLKDDYFELMNFVQKAWKWNDTYFERRKEKSDYCEYILHTGGWSGNEDLICAMRQNILFWAICWSESKRGGHYKFVVKLVKYSD